jgi:preprotein translocase subunit SecE
MSNRRILGFTWLVGALLTWLVLRAFVDWVWVDLMGRASQLGGTSLPIPALVSAVVTGAVAYYTWNKESIAGYCLEVIAELRKVVWPGKDELRDSTIVVIGCVFAFAAVLGGFDFVWAKLSNFILYRGG